jgi:ABC-type spermidine/putrescine transport system permease subunit II
VLILQLLSLSFVDRRLIEAAHNLGCSGIKTVFLVVIPAARVGLVLAVAFAFVLSFGDFISPYVVGGGGLVLYVPPWGGPWRAKAPRGRPISKKPHGAPGIL